MLSQRFASATEAARGLSSTDCMVMLRPSVILSVALICSIILVALGACASYAYFVVSKDIRFIADMFRLNHERNLPTFFSFCLLLFCSVLLIVIYLQQAKSASRWSLHWRLLAILFFLMAFDEAASVHEAFMPVVKAALDTGGFFYYSWVIPALIFVVIFALAYLRFVMALPPAVRGLFVVSGAIYVGGALGLEMPEGAYAEAYGSEMLAFETFTIIEEALEMVGLSVFAYALARFLAEQGEPVRLSLQTAYR